MSHYLNLKLKLQHAQLDQNQARLVLHETLLQKYFSRYENGTVYEGGQLWVIQLEFNGRRKVTKLSVKSLVHADVTLLFITIGN